MAIKALAEGVALTRAQGVAPDAVVDLMLETLFGCRAQQDYGGKIVAGDYEAGFRLALGLNDLRLAEAARQAAGERLPMLDAVRGQMTAAADAGIGERDWAAVADDTLSHRTAQEDPR